MDKQIKLWIDVLEHTNINSEALNELIQDMKRAKDETQRGVYPCDKCGDKVSTVIITCKTCYRKEHPWDTEV